MKFKKFRDPIHDFILVSSEELDIINSPIFQRMHNIKQLSLGYYVYHGTDHSRFGHVIGAMHLAGIAYDSLARNSKEFGDFDENPQDRKTLRIAALLHDVGHAPFSHSLESLLHGKHEDYSLALIDNYFKKFIENAGVNVEDVKNLILGAYPSKPYLSKIVSGQLDVDRLDYLLRDSHYAGVTYGKYDLGRIIDQLCVVDQNFVVLEGGYEAVEQMIFARYQMYQQVYFHKTKRAFELMLWKCGEILKDKEILEIPSLKDLATENGLDNFLQCDDRWFLNKIFRKDNPPEVQTIAEMIKNRRSYHEVYSPSINRKPPLKPRSGPDDSVAILEPIQKALKKNLPDLGIDDHEFLIDMTERSPYNLVPYTTENNEEEGSSIKIFYRNNKYLEPIEQRSHVIYTLGMNKPSMMRGFVIPTKYDKVRKFLETLDFHIPDRKEKL